MKEFSEIKLSSKQKKAIEMLVYEGKKKNEIAEEPKITPQTFSNWLNKNKNPGFVEAYENELENASIERQRLYKTAAQQAIQKLIALTGCKDKRVALNAVTEILDRAGDKATTSISVKTSEKLSDVFRQIGGEGLVE